MYNIYIIFTYLEKLVNSPNLNFGAARLVGSSPTVSTSFIKIFLIFISNLCFSKLPIEYRNIFSRKIGLRDEIYFY